MAKQMKSDEPDPLLDDAIRAAREEIPDDRQWETARQRLNARLDLEQRQWSRREGAQIRLRPRRARMAASFSLAALVLIGLVSVLISFSGSGSVQAASVTGGDLRIVGPDGQVRGSCPLLHTKVEANVTGFISRTILRQVFENPEAKPIEAVYVFPLPADAAVDSMVIVIGERRLVGKMMEREAARQEYQAAKAAGKVAGLLDQERPNIFTQSVANIAPGSRVEVEISYVETLKLEDGAYEYTFPMVVAPRYIPGGSETDVATGSTTGTAQVPDAGKITPPVAPPGTRAGHDIDLQVYVEAGSEIFEVDSPLHEVDVERPAREQVLVSLKNAKEIPNRDFVLRYRTATDAIGDAFLTADSPLGQYFALVLQPPRRVAPEEARPKEMIFVIDRSGSMSGEPIEKAKETMKLCIESMNPRDTFNLLSFSGGTGKCFDSPRPNTPETREAALKYLADLYGSGGTEMMPAILESLGRPADPERVRIVCFMTDGQIGNDYEIIDAVKKNAGTSRVFAFGIGNSTNRFLLDAMAREGRGEVQYVCLCEPAAEAARKFRTRIDSPVLTDIFIDWGAMPVADLYPKSIPDVFAEKPILVVGRLTGPPQGEIVLRGNTAKGAFERRITPKETTGPERRDGLDVIWARAKVKYLMAQDLRGMQSQQFQPELKDEITSLGVTYSIMTPFTSFVAVDEKPSVAPGATDTVRVPLEMPQGQTMGAGAGAEAASKLPALRSNVNFTYDPANGTVSMGDVYRVNDNESFFRTNTRFAQSTPLSAGGAPGSPAQAGTNVYFYAQDAAPGPNVSSRRAQEEYGLVAPGSERPAISGLPDIQVGDAEQNIGADANLFVYTDAFVFDHVPEEASNTSDLRWSFDEVDGDRRANTNWYKVNGKSSTASRQLAAGEKRDGSARPADRKEAEQQVSLYARKSAVHTTASASLAKLAPSLSSLLEAVDADGNLTTGPVVVQKYRTKVVVELTTTTQSFRLEAEQLGLVILEARATEVTANADIRTLRELAASPAVRRVRAAAP